MARLALDAGDAYYEVAVFNRTGNYKAAAPGSAENFILKNCAHGCAENDALDSADDNSGNFILKNSQSTLPPPPVQRDWLPPRPHDVDAADPKPHSRECADILRWRKPDASGRTRMGILKFRHRFMRAMESWFDAHGYTEIAMPVLVPAVNPEAHLALTRAESGWLSPSPELQMKRMLVGGFERIVSIGPVFRAREISARHNPEFTMAEWYHVWVPLETILDELEDLIASVWKHSPLNQGDGILRLARGKTITMDAHPWPRIPILDIVRNTLGLDLRGVTEAAELYERGYRAGLFAMENAGERYEQLFTRLWERCENALDYAAPVFITDWPAPLASLARLDPENSSIAKRAELLIAGMELANGFEELTNAAEQRARFMRDLETRREMAEDVGGCERDEAGKLHNEISDKTTAETHKPTESADDGRDEFKKLHIGIFRKLGEKTQNPEESELAKLGKLHNEISRNAGIRAGEKKQYPALPVMDEKFLEALEAGLPPSAGMALGFDRLCMLFTGAEKIRQVLPFASDEL
jgi:lysyl-tRNA synthetase class 2